MRLLTATAVVIISCAVLRGLADCDANEVVAATLAERAPGAAGTDVAETSSAAQRFVGSASCSLSGCHGHVPALTDPAKPRQNELSVWLTDPHSRSYQALFEPESVEILQRLGAIRDGEMPPAASNAAWQNCLKCHSPSFAGAGREFRGSVDGVGCEACHGTGDWIQSHHRTGREGKPPERGALIAQGLTDTQDLFIRAELCAGCHVGQADGDVDHELIAAGHPMLAFELSSYLRSMPAHWNEEREQQRVGADAQLRVWLAGQVVTAKSALDQLSRRVEESETWPEFAEQECFACHHGLTIEGRWRAEQGLVRASAGRIVVPWRSWNLGLVEPLLREVEHPQAADAIDALRLALQTSLVPDRELVIRELRTAIERLQTATVALQSGGPLLSEVDVARVHHNVVANVAGDERGALSSWERATQMFFALAADVEDRHHPPQDLVALRALLSEQNGTDSPASFHGETGDEITGSSRREEIRRLLKTMIRER